LDSTRRILPYIRFVPARRSDVEAVSPVEALSAAWRVTVRLLFRPFDRHRWIGLSIICLFLGGGASTAAFQWGFGALPLDWHASELFSRVRLVMAQHLSLIILSIVATLGLFLGLIYVRCVLRFVLIEAVTKQDVELGSAWKRLRSYGRSYFLWLLGVMLILLVIFAGAGFVSYRYNVLLREAGRPEWLASALLIMDLTAVVCTGLLVALIITLTDDLVAPLMYARKISLPAAWDVVARLAWQDFGTFLLYVVTRFAVGMGISVAVLFFLFPALMGLSSGALVTAALAVLTMRLMGLAWVWNPFTIFLAVLALAIFTSLLFAMLSVVGMPGQVYLQNYGIEFIMSRVPPQGTQINAD
jgi:hypothetical protein